MTPFTRLGRWARDDRGVVTVLFAAVAGLLLICAGIAVDYGRSVNLSTDFQKAADAAVLAATDDPFRSDSEIASVAHRFLQANSASLISDALPTATVSKEQTGVKVTISAQLPTSLLQLIGIDNIRVNVESIAAAQAGEIEIYAAIDMSESLSLAADGPNRTRMETATAAAGNSSCMFACHHINTGHNPTGITNRTIAQNAGILLREDVLASAFGAFVDTFMSTSDPSVAANKKRMAVIGFSEDAQLLLPPNNNASVIKLAPASFPTGSRWSTRYDLSLPTIRTMLGSQGTGFNGSARKMLLLITDGVHWDWSPKNGPIDISLCNGFKNDGISVAVLDVKYYEAVGEGYFEDLVRPFYTGISPALEACASPGLYFQAIDSDPPTMAAAFAEVAKALRTRLVLRQ